ncbi:protein kinase domain and HEAT repeat protein Ppk3 [Schizosaccharomyces osmophilus]|uniref:Protein kinase domain and HEAT repeat protein Ppk3 n=1 Tax=Schizosaccharomyces osmophilus TaxID=2545709 RepID=A0AAE9WEE0_9SCHI|nr:protein kinase domain and HEAT repeat protein Ppk3 [Schizosaccharomyces osmophilus]WBW73692.1 protein kinase domain and HEAT repeat protein Ppk3 [Schizosaccharomyces osmophilus]
MDFLKSAASLISKANFMFPYDLDQKVPLAIGSLWTLHNGRIKQTGEQCSIFSIPIAANPELVKLTEQSADQLKVIRHPCIIKILATYKDSTTLYIATEVVRPLIDELSSSNNYHKICGLWRVASALFFLEEQNLIHGNVQLSSIYLNESYEWVLGDFFLAGSNPNTFKKNFQILNPFNSLASSGVRDLVLHREFSQVDCIEFTYLVYQVFNSTNTKAVDLNQRENIPASIHNSLKKLVSQDSKQRISISEFLRLGERPGGFFRSNFIVLVDMINKMQIQDPADCQKLFELLKTNLTFLSPNYLQKKVLPVIFLSLKSGTSTSASELLFSIAFTIKDNKDFEKDFGIPLLSCLKTANNRVRSLLVDALYKHNDFLPPTLTSDDAFLLYCNFVRLDDPKLKFSAILLYSAIASKISKKALNNDLLRTLALLQNDAQPSIRINSIICLGKISEYLDQHIRTRVLVAALSKSLKDPIADARKATLDVMLATAAYFSAKELATKFLPCIVPLLVDDNESLRISSEEVTQKFLNRIKDFNEGEEETSVEVPSKSFLNIFFRPASTPRPKENNANQFEGIPKNQGSFDSEKTKRSSANTILSLERSDAAPSDVETEDQLDEEWMQEWDDNDNVEEELNNEVNNWGL